MAGIGSLISKVRRRKRERVAAERGFLTPEERRDLARAAEQHGSLARDSGKLGAALTAGPASFRRPRRPRR